MKYQTRINLFTLLIILFSGLSHARNHTISGVITNSETGEVIIGVGIYLESGKGVISNTYGFYSISTNNKHECLSYSYIGFRKKMIIINLHSDTTINIAISPESISLKEIIITGNSRKNILANEMGSQKISIEEIKRMPALIGETDILRSLQYLPGVNVGNEGANNISVRGGSYDQNLILLDEAVLYNPNHALSFFSTFNPDAISDAEIFKCAFPSKYGGRLSSVINVRMREGNNQRVKVNGGIGLISSRLSVEGPINKGNSSFILSGRYSNAGSVANLISNMNSIIPELKDFKKGNEVNFYDLNAKTNFKLSNHTRLFISGYLGKDHFYLKNFSDNFSIDWGNKASTIRLNHIFTPRIFSNTTFSYSHYSYQYYLKADVRNFLWQANMANYQLKSDFEHSLSNEIKLKYGLSSGFLHTLPGKVTPFGESSVIKPSALQKRKSVELGGYIEGEMQLSASLNLKAGIRFSSFSELGLITKYSNLPGFNQINDSAAYVSGKMKTFNHLEPRLLVNYILSDNSSVKASYCKMHQYLHLLSNSSVGLPTDIWMPSGNSLSPESSDQFSLGYFCKFSDNMFETSVEAYYKKMDHVIDFIDNANIFMNQDIESQMRSGKADSYGIELFINKKTGVIKGWLSYTLSKTSNKIDGINNNRPYSAAYDKRHNLKLMLFYELSRRYTFSSSFSYISGNNLTVPMGSFEYYGSSFNYYTERNGYKVSPFHELNLALTRHSSNRHKWNSEWIFSINNVYNRHNIFSIYTRQDEFNLSKSKTYKLYLYGILPSVTYNFNF